MRAGDEGIDIAAITTDLEREGVRSFCESSHELLQCFEAKKAPLSLSIAAPIAGV